MPAPKGSRNAKAYQEDLISTNRELVEVELAKFREVRAEFPSMTALSIAISKSTGLANVTLRRNRVYRELILNYINTQSTRSAYISRADAELNMLRHKVTNLELRVSNALADNDRLRAFIGKINTSPTEVPKLPICTPTNVSETGDEHDLLRTFQLVNALVSRAYFSINFDNDTIEDTVGIDGDEVVAGKNIAQPYVEWRKSESER